MSSRDGDSPKRSSSLHHDVCRDYLNKICNRPRCKFYHPPDEELHLYDKKLATLSDNRSPQDYHFCYEYQSSSEGCIRPSCRYLHCAQSSAEHFTKTGKIDLEMAKAIVAQNPGLGEVSERPLCKEFLNNKCRRAEKCRFWHINPIYEQQQRMGPGKRSKNSGARFYSNQETPGRYDAQSPNYYDQYGDSKRPKYLYDSPAYHGPPVGQPNSQSPYHAGAPGGYSQVFNSPSAQYQVQMPIQSRESIGESSLKSILSSENVELQRTYELLLKTVNDLRASNESLLSENAALRATWQHVTGHASQSAPDAGAMVDQSQMMPNVVYYK